MKLSELLAAGAFAPVTPPPARPAPVAVPAPTVASSGFFSDRGPVGDSADLRRILALPRRTLTPGAVDLTDELRRPGGTMRLFPIQSLALHEARVANGLLGMIGAGMGKTLTSLLLPTVLGAKNTVLLIPPALRNQLLARDYPALSKHFRVPFIVYPRDPERVPHADATGFLHVVAYSELSSTLRADILERINPDLVIADEAHNLRATSAARTKRFRRFFKDREAAGRPVRFCALSGTMSNRSLKDYWHLAKLALGDGSPLPIDWHTLDTWAAALDVSKFPAPEGELRKLCDDFEDVRSGFRRRLISTPGVVATSENELGASLVIHARNPRPDAGALEALRKLRAGWELPDGQTFDDALSFYRAARQLALGFWLRWKWPRNEPEPLRREWIAARKAWFADVRDFLTYRARPGADSPKLVARAAEDGRLSFASWAPWRDIREACRPESECVWVSDFAVKDAVAWGEKHTGVIWTDSPDLGRAVAKAGGLTYFGQGDEASVGIALEDGRRTIVASIDAHGEGKNLQAFHNQLITSFPATGKTSEQLLARLHREGQTADEVNTWVYLHTPEMQKALESARTDAEYVFETLGQQQRLRYASYTF